MDFDNDRIRRIEQQMRDANRVTSTFANLIYSSIESLAEFGALIPLLEIMVTIFAYWRSGLGALFGLEVLAGLVFAQVAALFLTAHYKNVAMHQIGEAAVYGAVGVGAANTGIAIYLALALSHNETAVLPTWVVYFPAISSAAAVLFIYLAKMFTMERVSSRLKFRTESNAEIRDIKRKAAAQHQNATHLDTMQNTQMQLQSDTMTQLAADPLIRNAYTLIMREQALKNVLMAFNVNPNTKIAKLLQQQIIKANEEAAAGDEPGQPRPSMSWPVDTNGVELVDLQEGDPNG